VLIGGMPDWTYVKTYDFLKITQPEDTPLIPVYLWPDQTYPGTCVFLPHESIRGVSLSETCQELFNELKGRVVNAMRETFKVRGMSKKRGGWQNEAVYLLSPHYPPGKEVVRLAGRDFYIPDNNVSRTGSLVPWEERDRKVLEAIVGKIQTKLYKDSGQLELWV